MVIVLGFGFANYKMGNQSCTNVHLVICSMTKVEDVQRKRKLLAPKCLIWFALEPSLRLMFFKSPNWTLSLPDGQTFKTICVHILVTILKYNFFILKTLIDSDLCNWCSLFCFWTTLVINAEINDRRLRRMRGMIMMICKSELFFASRSCDKFRMQCMKQLHLASQLPLLFLTCFAQWKVCQEDTYLLLFCYLLSRHGWWIYLDRPNLFQHLGAISTRE